MPRLLLLLVLAASAACGVKADGPPEIEVDRTACSHCGMLISEPASAAAYQAPGAAPRVFDDIGCLLDAVGREPRSGGIRFWFHDVANGAWIGGDDAVFVSSPNLRTPMGGGLIDYRDLAAARDGAARHRGAVINSLNDLLRSNHREGHRASPQAR
jgi:nitrous oxide reductase accessory protein NosL